jgi:hypothetical protein
MRYLPLLVAIAVCLSSANAQPLEPRTEIIEQFDDLRMVAFVPTADITNSPAWDADTSEPPLSVAEAIRAVRDFAGSSSGPVREIELRPVPGSTARWHYLVKAANAEKTTRYDLYVILMNGKVVPAMIEPESVR